MHQQQPPAPTRPQPRRTRLATTLTLALGLLTLTSCAPHTTSITVFAPSSLSRAGADLQAAYQEAHPGQTITINYAGSPQLIQHISNGATPDILITADATTMTQAQTSTPELSQGTPTTLAYNQLTLATAPNNPANIHTIQDLATPGTITALCAPQVPCGTLAQEALNHAHTTPATSTQEANASNVSAKLASGQVDAAFIYTTDAAALSQTHPITTIPLPNLPANPYPLLLTATGTKNPQAQELATWLTTSPDATRILTHHGFTTP